MVKRFGGDFWTINVRIKIPFQDEKSLKNFKTNFKKYYKKEDKIKKTKSSKKKTEKNSKEKLFDITVKKDYILILHDGTTQSKKIKKSDRILNKLISFVEVEAGLRRIRITYTKSSLIVNSPVVSFVNKTMMEDLNSKIKQT